MKSIIIPHYSKPDPNSTRTQYKKYYTIAIGGATIREKSEKNILKVKAHLQKMYTRKLHEANLLVVDYFQTYRMAWTYLDNDLKLQRELDFDLKSILENIQRSTEHRGPNANQFIHQGIIRSFELMEKGFEEMGSLFARMNYFDRRQHCDVLSIRARSCVNDIESMLELLAWNDIEAPEPFRKRMTWMHQQKNFIDDYMKDLGHRKNGTS